jgi:hypothetical protein
MVPQADPVRGALDVCMREVTQDHQPCATGCKAAAQGYTKTRRRQQHGHTNSAGAPHLDDPEVYCDLWHLAQHAAPDAAAQAAAVVNLCRDAACVIALRARNEACIPVVVFCIFGAGGSAWLKWEPCASAVTELL